MQETDSSITYLENIWRPDYAWTGRLYTTTLGLYSQNNPVSFLRQRYVRLGTSRPSVRLPSVRLLSVTLLHPTQWFKLSGNILAPSNSLGTRTICTKILEKGSKGLVIGNRVQVKWNGAMKNWHFWPISRFHSFIHSFTHSLIAICRANHVENVESEAQALEARWSVIGKVVSF